MTLNTTITASLPALLGVAAVLLATGWAIATTWPLLRLHRMRARNLRIVADLRRLTHWLPPAVHREAGNWNPVPLALRDAGGYRSKATVMARPPMASMNATPLASAAQPRAGWAAGWGVPGWLGVVVVLAALAALAVADVTARAMGSVRGRRQ